jgi:hypothetical protein
LPYAQGSKFHVQYTPQWVDPFLLKMFLFYDEHGSPRIKIRIGRSHLAPAARHALILVALRLGQAAKELQHLITLWDDDK